MRIMKQYALASLLAFLFFAVGILTVHDYGINWDAPLDMLRGQAIAHLFLTGKTSYGEEVHLSPLLITPKTYASRYYFAASEVWENEDIAKVGLPQRPIPQEEFKKVRSSPRRASHTGCVICRVCDMHSNPSTPTENLYGVRDREARGSIPRSPTKSSQLIINGNH